MITSTNNVKVKNLVQLQKKKKLRDEQGVFIVEGIRMFREIPVSDMLEIYATEKFYNANIDAFKGVVKTVEMVTDEVFSKISETKTPQGILCVVKRHSYTLNDLMGDNNKLLVVLESVQDPGNVGTIIRAGEAAGATGFILTKDCADIYQSKTIRSTMGSIFRKKCVYVDEIVDTLQVLKANGVETYAAHLDGKAWHNEIKYNKDTAFLIGNEGNGLSDTATDMADTKIKIPMAGEVESLNAAIAATLLMYEAFNQRR